ncbi:hypothetical protein QVD17_25828 [Tagetes erecta]|uniref:Uncharacterized protein n=1 Tax=Tagetes erecta TaxID=13708 RepID=A0AAD8K9R6_TARER|nr:hypothetical protein QVD17_25828 [Tagetes erecta]
MANVTTLITLVLLCTSGSLLICASSTNEALDMQLREDTRSILDKHGFDQPLLKYYWRRAMLANVPQRLAPGGPDGHHH